MIELYIRTFQCLNDWIVVLHNVFLFSLQFLELLQNNNSSNLRYMIWSDLILSDLFWSYLKSTYLINSLGQEFCVERDCVLWELESSFYHDPAASTILRTLRPTNGHIISFDIGSRWQDRKRKFDRQRSLKFKVLRICSKPEVVRGGGNIGLGYWRLETIRLEWNYLSQ